MNPHSKEFCSVLVLKQSALENMNYILTELYFSPFPGI